MKRTSKWQLFVMIITCSLLSSCLMLMTDPAPSDGRVTISYKGAQASAVLPVSARGRRLSSPSPTWFMYANELNDLHTVGASVLVEAKIHTDKTDQQYLAWWMELFEQELPKGPGRKGAVLRSVERVEAARLQTPTENALCVEYIWVSEDRLVPGHKGKAFIMHVHEYVCIHPDAHVLVKLHFSERFPVERYELRQAFEQDADFFFDSLRLH